MSEPTAGEEPVVIEVETERVEGVVDLDDVVGIVRALQEETVRPQGPLRPFLGQLGRPGDPGGRPSQLGQLQGAVGRPAPDVSQRLEQINRLAGELAEQLAELSRLRGQEL